MTSAPITPIRKWGALAICCVAALLLGIDNSVLNLAIPSLTADMRPSATQILWIADVYGFTMGGLLIFMGNLGDRIGRKKLLLAGTIAFGLASAITAYATSPGLLIGARALLGIAGAAIMPSTLSLIRNTFTEPAERTMAMGISGGVGAGGFALGPIVGGVLLDHFWWGSVFLINVPVMLLVLGFGTVVLPESRNPRPGRLDLVSVPLSVVGMIGVTYAIKAAARDGAAEPIVWITAAIGVVALVVFVRRQTRLAEPLLDVKLFRNPAFSGSVGSNLITIFSLSALSLIFAQYFQVVRGWSPLTSGLALLLGPVGAMIGGPLVTLLIGKWGRARVVSVGLGLMSVSMVGFSRVGTDSSYTVLAVPLLLNGIGLGLTFGTTNDTLLATAPKERAGGASAIGETAMEFGGALGIAVLGSLASALYRGGLALPAGLPAEAVHAARQSVGGAVATGAAFPGATGTDLIAAAGRAFVASIQTTTLVGAALLTVGAVFALFTLRGVPAEIPGPKEQDPAAEGPAVPAPLER
jgi:DHA2 family multidrug resistance protein-like MFS transporter